MSGLSVSLRRHFHLEKPADVQDEAIARLPTVLLSIVKEYAQFSSRNLNKTEKDAFDIFNRVIFFSGIAEDGIMKFKYKKSYFGNSHWKIEFSTPIRLVQAPVNGVSETIFLPKKVFFNVLGDRLIFCQNNRPSIERHLGKQDILECSMRPAGDAIVATLGENPDKFYRAPVGSLPSEPPRSESPRSESPRSDSLPRLNSFPSLTYPYDPREEFDEDGNPRLERVKIKNGIAYSY